MLIVGDTFKIENTEVALRAYYDFFVKLYGSNRFTTPTFTTDPKKRNLFDKFDTNLQLALDAINIVNNGDTVKILEAYENSNLVAIARFRIMDGELLISDIVFTENKQDCVDTNALCGIMISFLEDYAKENGITTVVVEVPLFDTAYRSVAENMGYTGSLDEGVYTTVLLEKKLLDLGQGDDFGRYRISKQTKRFDK